MPINSLAKFLEEQGLCLTLFIITGLCLLFYNFLSLVFACILAGIMKIIDNSDADTMIYYSISAKKS